MASGASSRPCSTSAGSGIATLAATTNTTTGDSDHVLLCHYAGHLAVPHGIPGQVRTAAGDRHQVVHLRHHRAAQVGARRGQARPPAARTGRLRPPATAVSGADGGAGELRNAAGARPAHQTGFSELRRAVRFLGLHHEAEGTRLLISNQLSRPRAALYFV